MTRQTDNALVRPAASGRRQFRRGRIRYINPNHGKVAALKFPDVRATATTDRLRPVLMWVGADAFDENHRPRYLTIVK